MKAVILAAGEGTRLRPFTYTHPKALIPLAGTSLIEHSLEALEHIGVKTSDIYVVVNHLKERLKSRLKGVKYLEQEEVLGTAHAIKMADFMEDTFIVIYADNVYSKNDLKRLVEAHKAKDNKATLATYRVKRPEGLGILNVHNGHVVKIEEKPEETKTKEVFVNTGMYVLEPEIFDAIAKTKKSVRNEYEITDSLQIMIDRHRKVGYCELKDYWFDVCRPWDIVEAHKVKLDERVSEKSEVKGEIDGNVYGSVSIGKGSVVEKNATIHGSVIIGENTTIAAGSYLRGPATIGNNCFIGPFSHIRQYASIGNGCKLGNASEVKSSIIMDDTNVPHLNYVGDSVIGSKVNLAAGTITSNLRHDNGNIKMYLKGKKILTGRKVGAFIGDYTKTGVNTSVQPGIRLGPFSWTGPGEIVSRDLRPFRLLMGGKERMIPRETVRKIVDKGDGPFYTELYNKLLGVDEYW